MYTLVLVEGAKHPQAPCKKGRYVGMCNRKRNRQIKMAMTELELERFDKEYCKTRYKSRADFVLALVDKQPIVVIESLAPILTELRRQGVNLNQIAHKLNATDAPDIHLQMANLISRWVQVYEKLNELEQEVIANAVIQRSKR